MQCGYTLKAGSIVLLMEGKEEGKFLSEQVVATAKSMEEKASL